MFDEADIEGLGYVHIFGRIHSLAWYREWLALVHYLTTRNHLLGNQMLSCLIDADRRNYSKE